MKIKYINKNLPAQFFNSAEITIGREEDNSMQLLSDGISRHHGRIYLSGGNWYISSPLSLIGEVARKNAALTKREGGVASPGSPKKPEFPPKGCNVSLPIG